MTWIAVRDACKRYGWQLLVAVPLLILFTMQVLGRFFRKKPDLVDEFLEEQKRLAEERLEVQKQEIAQRDAAVAGAEAAAGAAVAHELAQEQAHTEQVVSDPVATNAYLHDVGNKIRGG